jgi:eukaryotic-like serine/threonine-protein kinase
MLGTTFANFTVMERLNRGGMADIFVAMDGTGNRYTLRVLLSEYHFSWGRIRQFKWGCKVLSQMDHPNVVHFYGYGKFSGQRYAVLEYVDGPNLKELILKSDPQLRANQLKLLHGMAAGLAHVHERGFVHLDFKPENVVVSSTYDAKICDFDLAIERPDRPRRISLLSGTPSYLAPEQIAREPVDERADVFAYGLTAYEMLCGRKPVAAATRAELMQKYAQFNDHLKPLRTYVKDIPQFIEKVVLKCLEKDVARRYPSMSLVVRDLQQ